MFSDSSGVSGSAPQKAAIGSVGGSAAVSRSWPSGGHLARRGTGGECTVYGVQGRSLLLLIAK
jgi:hypothetical protein